MIDCHAHLSASDFDADRPQVLERAWRAGVEAILVVGEDRGDNARVSRLLTELAAGSVPRLLGCFGLHPDRFADDRPMPTPAEIGATLGQIREQEGTLAAIGEVGLDYWYAKSAERRRAQADLLERVAELSIDLGLPLNVHSRSAGHYAIDLLIGAGVRRVLMHAFDGKASHAVRAAERGYLFSLPPSVIRSEQKQKLARTLPLESLALESDSPVLGPDPGARNEPANILQVRDFLAITHGVSPERVDEITTANAARLFPRLGSVTAEVAT